MAPLAAILISRQPLRPCGCTPWVVNTAAAAQWVASNGMHLCSSVGMQTWELVTSLGSLLQIPTRLIVAPGRISTTELYERFGLHPNQTEIIEIAEEASGNKERMLHRRDVAVVEAADVLLPVSIRPGGRLDRLMHQAALEGKRIVRDFYLSEPTRHLRLAYLLLEESINPQLRCLERDYLIHWTRASNTAWPDERPLDYFASIVASFAYPRSAFDTLRRIVASRRLLASTRHMPRNMATVAFSSLSPCEVVPLMRWRSRYSEMAFEPYGIAIRKDCADQLGIRPVRYTDARTLPVDSGEIWQYQSLGTRTDWRQEHEFRHLGSLSLDDVPPDALLLLCRSTNEAEQLRQEFGYSVLSFEE